MQKNIDTYAERAEKLKSIIGEADADTALLVGPLVDEIVALEKRMDDLRGLPFISVHPKNDRIQKTTPAAKLYKECSQSYMNGVRILAGVLKKSETAAADELSKRLEEFMT